MLDTLGNYILQEINQRRDRQGIPPQFRVRILYFHCRGCKFNPWSGNYDPASCMVLPKEEKNRQMINDKCTRMSTRNTGEQCDRPEVSQRAAAVWRGKQR